MGVISDNPQPLELIMNSPQFGLKVASVLAGLFGVAHLLRIVTELEITMGGWHVSLWLSLLAMLAAGGCSYWFRRLADQTKPTVRP